MKTFQTYLEEGVGDGGLVYERKVRDSIAAASPKIDRFKMMPDLAGGYASNVVDLYLQIKGKQYGIEIKQNKNAQMGGSSIKYKNGKFDFAEKGKASIELDTQQMIIDALSEKKNDIEKLFSAVKQIEPKDYHKNTDTIPFKATKSAFEELTRRGFLKPLNVVMKKDAKFIADHYAKKDCYYIQIGGAGLFYLKKNPLNLPIPQLQGDINIEIRLGRSGSSMVKSIGEKAASSSLRVQARFKGKGKSPYSLDNPEHVILLFSNIE